MCFILPPLENETVFHVTLEYARVGFVDLFNPNQFNVRGAIAVTAFIVVVAKVLFTLLPVNLLLTGVGSPPECSPSLLEPGGFRAAPGRDAILHLHPWNVVFLEQH